MCPMRCQFVSQFKNQLIRTLRLMESFSRSINNHGSSKKCVFQTSLQQRYFATTCCIFKFVETPHSHVSFSLRPVHVIGLLCSCCRDVPVSKHLGIGAFRFRTFLVSFFFNSPFWHGPQSALKWSFSCAPDKKTLNPKTINPKP